MGENPTARRWKPIFRHTNGRRVNSAWCHVFQLPLYLGAINHSSAVPRPTVPRRKNSGTSEAQVDDRNPLIDDRWLIWFLLGTPKSRGVTVNTILMKIAIGYLRWYQTISAFNPSIDLSCLVNPYFCSFIHDFSWLNPLFPWFNPAEFNTDHLQEIPLGPCTTPSTKTCSTPEGPWWKTTQGLI